MDTILRGYYLSLQNKAQEQIVVNPGGNGVAGGYVFRGEKEAKCPDGKERSVTSPLYRCVCGWPLQVFSVRT